MSKDFNSPLLIAKEETSEVVEEENLSSEDCDRISRLETLLDDKDSQVQCLKQENAQLQKKLVNIEGELQKTARKSILKKETPCFQISGNLEGAVLAKSSGEQNQTAQLRVKVELLQRKLDNITDRVSSAYELKIEKMLKKFQKQRAQISEYKATINSYEALKVSSFSKKTKKPKKRAISKDKVVKQLKLSDEKLLAVKKITKMGKIGKLLGTIMTENDPEILKTALIISMNKQLTTETKILHIRQSFSRTIEDLRKQLNSARKIILLGKNEFFEKYQKVLKDLILTSSDIVSLYYSITDLEGPHKVKRTC